MSINQDYYGNVYKHFIGVVKDVNDPLDSNRVQVRIKGVHPEDDESTYSSSANFYGGENYDTGTSTTGASLVEIDESKLPNAGQINAKISQHFTLANLTIGATGPHSRSSSARGINQGLLTPRIIKNLSNLSTNCLDPIYAHYGKLQINSGWRLGYSAADRSGGGGNHPQGFAADIVVNRGAVGELAGWIQSNLRGRFTMMLVYPTFIHLQLGGSARQGTLESPVIRGGRNRGVK